MTVEQASELVRQALIMALITAAPMLLIGLMVGLAVSLFQAITQIQEQTLTFIPKIAAMVAAAVLLLPWTTEHLVEYARVMLGTGQMP